MLQSELVQFVENGDYIMQRHEMMLYRALFICFAVIVTASIIYVDRNARDKVTPAGLTINTEPDDGGEPAQTASPTPQPMPVMDGASAVDAAYGVAYIENTNQILINRRIWEIRTEDCTVTTDDNLLYIVSLNVAKSGTNRYKPINGQVLQSYTFDGSVGELRLQASSPLIIDVSYTDDFVLLSMQTLKDQYNRIIFIDPGHGGVDDGAVRAGYKEKDINLKIALLLYDMLIDNLETTGIYPILSRTGDTFITPKDRGLEGSRQADIIVAIHCNTYANSESVNGTEVHYKPHQPLDGSSRSGLNNTELGRIMVDSVSEAIGSRNRGMFERDDLGLLNAATVPCVIVETGYLTNLNERALLVSEDYQKKIADGLYNGIQKAFNE